MEPIERPILMLRSGRGLKAIFIATALLIASGMTAPSVLADLIPEPPHPHPEPAPNPTVTWVSGTHAPGDGHALAIHQHQHRTNHNPRQGTMSFGGVAPYNTFGSDWVWVGRSLVVVGGAGHGVLPNEFAHGHQGHSPNGANLQPPARYFVQFARPGGDITVAEAFRWNTNAAARVFDAFNGIGNNPGWLDVGNAAGPRNWPNSDDDRNPGTGNPWHSSVSWQAVGVTEPHELRIVYGEAGGKGLTRVQRGHHGAGAAAMTLTIDDDINWFWGVDANPAHSANQDDAQTTILHEIGHVLGLGHFGTYDAGYIMAARTRAGVPGRPNRGGLGGIDHSIDLDAIHGIRDLYAVASDRTVPEPSALALLGFGLTALGGVAWRRQSRK